MRIDPDAWDDWAAHPLTEAFMTFCRVQAAQQQARWLRISWDGGEANPLMLARLQERSTTLEEVAALSREDIEEGLSNAKR